MSWISEILFCLAPVFKALSNTVDHHFDTSVFARQNPRFWDRDISSYNAKRIGGYKLDAWHLAESGMIWCMIFGTVLHQPKIEWYYEVAIAGAAWILIFNVFYNKLFLQKKYRK